MNDINNNIYNNANYLDFKESYINTINNKVKAETLKVSKNNKLTL